VTVEWQDEAIREIARIAARVNASSQDIGARRLHTVVEKLLERVSFEAPEMAGVTVIVDVPFVRESLAEVLERDDLERFIL
jgi:ATP-dependent HslUV protease ATP-binding subunit HslU